MDVITSALLFVLNNEKVAGLQFGKRSEWTSHICRNKGTLLVKVNIYLGTLMVAFSSLC